MIKNASAQVRHRVASIHIWAATQQVLDPQCFRKVAKTTCLSGTQRCWNLNVCIKLDERVAQKTNVEANVPCEHMRTVSAVSAAS